MMSGFPKLALRICCLWGFIFTLQSAAMAQNDTSNIAIVIHGGAGYITESGMSDSLKRVVDMELRAALNLGYRILERGGTSLEAVEAAIVHLENSPHFNAGRGAVLTAEGKVELDASIMSGKERQAGAVAGISGVKNPIKAAVAVLQKSPHVLLSGEGAVAFAKEQGLEMETPEYFITEKSRKALERAKQSEDNSEGSRSKNPDYKYGTVGAVALDRFATISAGTSTGGMTNKRHGRIGDSPIIGAGTYANNETCGISCTGHGEFFIRLGAAKDISAQMKYGGKSLSEAADHFLAELNAMKAPGGLIGLDAKGNYIMKFNTKGMYRGFKNAHHEEVLMFGE